MAKNFLINFQKSGRDIRTLLDPQTRLQVRDQPESRDLPRGSCSSADRSTREQCFKTFLGVNSSNLDSPKVLSALKRLNAFIGIFVIYVNGGCFVLKSSF